MANQVLPAPKFMLTSQIIDTKSLLDETNFYNQKQGSPDELTKKLTYMLGRQSNFPLATMTMGGSEFGNKNSIKEIKDTQYTYPIMGKLDKVSITTDTIYTSTDEPGKGNTPFYLYFADNYIKRFYILQSENGTQVYVLEELEAMPTGGYRAKVQLTPAGPSDFCPPSQTYAGVKWIKMYTAVPESQSRTTEGNMAMPGSAKNQITYSRLGYSWAGNTANKIMKIKIKGVDGQETETWMDWFMWQFENNWLNDCEHLLWYGRYNRHSDGTIPLKDNLTGKVISTGSGLLEQILNKGTYSELTYQSLVNKVGDALFGQSDTGGMVITLMGGTGTRRDMDRIIREAGGQLLGNNWGNVADKFISGSGSNLAFGGFFDTFYHIDGYTIKFKYNSMFDTGRAAMVSPIHPKSGLPLESHRMVFIDDSDIDGEPNIQYVGEQGRLYLDGVIPGLTPMPRSLQILTNTSGSNYKFLSTDMDQSSYVRFASKGVQLLRGNRCFDLECKIGV